MKDLFKSPLFWIILVVAVGVGGYFLFFKGKKDTSKDTTYKNIDNEPDTVVLKKGVSGQKVVALQQKLIGLDDTIKSIMPTADGQFGSQTEEALKKYQVPDANGAKALSRIEVPYNKINDITKA